MSQVSELLPLLNYAAPPVVGAFIGYLTNKIAIKMLFRPLKPWRFLGMRVPFTPGVIPSKRHELAVNIGEMVGEHLLTSKEIGQALGNQAFQDHLYRLIEERGNLLSQRDLGPLSSLIPKGYQGYFDIAVKALSHHAQEAVHGFMASPSFAALATQAVEQQLDRVLNTSIAKILPGQTREGGYAFIEKNLQRMLGGHALEQWAEGFVQDRVYATLSQNKSLADVLPESLQDLAISTIERQTPALLARLAVVVQEPEIRDRIVHGVRLAVENFIDSMGPMAGMVKGFLSMETVERKVRDYMVSKESEIVDWLQNDEVQQRVAAILRERSQAFLTTPLVKFAGQADGGAVDDRVERFCAQFSRQLVAFLREPGTTSAISSMLRDNLETSTEGGALSVGEALWDLLGEEGLQKGRAWVAQEVVTLLRSTETRRKINTIMQSLLDRLLERPIGRIADLLPLGVREGIYLSLQKMASAMLADEVPGLVDSLNLKQIVSEKVDSLDLLRLERLLLSIMEEQFKYINLFGAILGFLIGGLNVLAMLAL